MSGHLSALVAGILLAATAGSAQGRDLSALTAEAAQTPAEKLALCDTTAFLATHPDTRADAIYVQLEGAGALRLHPPLFLAAGRLYRQGDEDLFQKMRGRGELTRADLARAQADVGARLIAAYSPERPLPAAFVQDQLRYCDRLGASYGVDLDF